MGAVDDEGPIGWDGPQACTGVDCYIVDVMLDSLAPRVFLVFLGVPRSDGGPNPNEFVDVRTNKTVRVRTLSLFFSYVKERQKERESVYVSAGTC